MTKKDKIRENADEMYLIIKETASAFEDKSDLSLHEKALKDACDIIVQNIESSKS